MINFDNAATTEGLGNPNSPHMLGIEAERMAAAASEKLAGIIGCRADEIVYTSGGTESNNLALLGAAEPFAKRGGLILTTPYEHPSVLEPLRYIKSKGQLDVIECHVTEWKNYLDKGCVLASCTHVNHETGDVNNLAEISAMLKKANGKIIFHSDGAQGFCKENMPPDGVDLYSFSAHKFGGPSGMGGLVARRGTQVKPVMHGGGQQRGLRPGTLNVPGILGMTEAAAAAWNARDELRANAARVKEILINGIRAGLPGVFVNTVPDMFIGSGPGSVSPFILNVSFMGIKGEHAVHELSRNGIYASMGAACRSGKKDVSPLERMNISKARAESAVRFSFWNNTEAEAKAAVAEIIKCVRWLTQIA